MIHPATLRQLDEGQSSTTAELNPDTKQTTLIHNNSWTNRDYRFLFCLLLIGAGDSVELYLPGVITQAVSCELGVSRVQEGWLGIIIYTTMAASLVIAGAVTNRFGSRRILLFSLYTAILFTVLCALVPNYYTLLLSRGLIGICMGFSFSTMGVFFSENVSSPSVRSSGIALNDMLYTIAAGWVAILGYMLLDKVGWRVFVLCTSLPLFLPPIPMLHCCLNVDERTGKVGSEKTERIEKEIVVVPKVKERIFKASVLQFINHLQGYGSVLLLPALLRVYNERRNPPEEEDCSSVVQGSQFLILALINGGANLVGRVAGFFLLGRIKFRVLQPIIALMVALSYGVLIIDTDHIVVMVVAMGLAKIGYSMTMLQITVMCWDPEFFGTATLALGSGVCYAFGSIGSVVGNVLAVFVEPNVAVICTFVFSCIQIAAVCSITEL